MNIILLQGSPRKKGNTAKALAWLEADLTALGHTVETLFLGSYKLNPCLACAKCKEAEDRIGCVQKDDTLDILKKMVGAGAVVFGSPLYFWGVTAQLKTLIDRTYSLYTEYHMPGHTSLVEGQRQALLMTGGGPWENNAEAAFTAFSRLQKPHKARHAGELFIPGCTAPENLGQDARDQVRAFAEKIVQ